MSFLTRLFQSKSNPEDYASVLSSLQTEIDQRKLKLSEIRLRERRTSLLVTLWTCLVWAVWVAGWYFRLIPIHARTPAWERIGKTFPVFVGPVFILFIRRIVQLWYKRIGDAEEKTLQKQTKILRTKVEDIKKKTNYYSTRELIQRYDDSPSSNGDAGTPPRGGRQSMVPQGRGGGPRASMMPGTPQTPQSKPLPGGVAMPGSSISGRGLAPISVPAPPPQPSAPTQPPQKQWYDRFADAILGPDTSGQEGRDKYALICEKCFWHCGLVEAARKDKVQFVCPKCSYFNRSQRSRMFSPTSPNNANTPQGPPSGLPTSSSMPTSSPVTPMTAREGSSALREDGEGMGRRRTGHSASREQVDGMEIDGEEET